MSDEPTERPATNWAGNYSYRAEVMHQPTTLDELCDIVRSASSVRVLGSRHSFSDIGDAAALIDLRSMLRDPSVDVEASTVTVSGAATYAEVAQVLQPHGLALHNLASLPHISVAGAIATATHGSGRANGNLATAVSALTFVDGLGEIRTVEGSDPDFGGAVVSLGALGPILDVTLDVVPAFDVAQSVFEGIDLGTAVEHLDEIMAMAYSASIFTTFAGPHSMGNVWLKRRVDGSEPTDHPGDVLFGAQAARSAHHPVPGLDAASCTEQSGLAGPWSERLPHFKMGFAPSAGDEVQSEFFVDAAVGAAALGALVAAADRFAHQLMVAEVRAIDADNLWMSPQYGRPTIAFHFTWRPDTWRPDESTGGDLESAVRAVESALRPYEPLPHWGKVFFDDIAVAERYERFGDYVGLLDRVDPRGVFRNDWWHRVCST